ncbi:MAG: FKBP-type peptidyl-prolyl cis-trans isomerase [Waddliaceae bacterium]
MKTTFTFLILSLSLSLFSANQKVGEHLGYVIAKYFEDEDIDSNDIIKGIKNYQSNKTPQLTESELHLLYDEFIIKQMERDAQSSLSASEDLLRNIKSETGVIEVIPNTLYVKNFPNENPGKQLTDQGMFHITCKTVHGNTLINTRLNNIAVFQDLDQAIPGSALGVKGMYENERRVLYIHPSLAYNDSSLFEPNTALIIDVEFTKHLES